MFIEVGKLYQEGKAMWAEGIKVDFENSGGQLYIVFNNPTKQEIEEIRKEDCKIGIFEKNEVIFLLFKFGDMEWMDVPYTVHLSKGLVLEKIQPGMGYAITILLINSANGILEAIRLVSMPTKISQLFYDAVQRQRIQIFDYSKYWNTLDKIYSQYETKDMVKMGTTEKVRGNL